MLVPPAWLLRDTSSLSSSSSVVVPAPLSVVEEELDELVEGRGGGSASCNTLLRSSCGATPDRWLACLQRVEA